MTNTLIARVITISIAVLFVFKISFSAISVTVLKPNGGETWDPSITATRDIRWGANETASPVEISYSTDNGTTWKVIAASAPNTGAYSWALPYENSAQCIIRIIESDSSVQDESDAVFSLSAPVITVTAPVTNDTLLDLTAFSITWDTLNPVSDSVQLFSSSDNAVTWQEISAKAPNSGSYNWLVPGITSLNYQIKVADYSCPDDVADIATFNLILQSLTITSPVAQSQWQGTTTQAITWGTTSISSTVNLYYSPDNGSSWLTLVEGTANDGSYDWVLPDTALTEVLVRITDPQNTVEDTSAVFSILMRSNTAPAILNADSIEVTLDATVNWIVSASDGEGDPVVFTFTGLPAWITALNDSTLTLSPVTPGDAIVTVLADDGRGGLDTLQLRVLVKVPVSLRDALKPEEAGLGRVFTNRDGHVIITYSLVVRQKSAISIYTINGELINNLQAADDPGYHSTLWNGTNSQGIKIETGFYFIQLKTGRQSFVKRIVFGIN